MECSRKVGTNLLLSSLCLMFILLLPALALADPPLGKKHGQGKGKKVGRIYDGRGWRYRYENNWRSARLRSKKEEKFINGHDARDGRWDGRGPKFKIRRLPRRF